MKAVVVEKAGGPEVLQIKDIPKPQPREGWVLVEIKAFGLNRSELFTRQGDSPSVTFPRVLGIECAGIVEAAPGTGFTPGQRVVAITGGAQDLPPEALARIIQGIKAGSVRVNLDRVFKLDEIVEAHRYMESNQASGKVVCLV